MAQKDYPEFEGKEVIWKYNDTLNEIPAIVIGCNYDIGITIVKKHDKTSKLMCLNGPSSPQPLAEMNSEKGYKTRFYSAIAEIRRGFIDCRKDLKIDTIIDPQFDPIVINMVACPWLGK